MKVFKTRILFLVFFVFSSLKSFSQNHYETPFKMNGYWVNSYVILLEPYSWEEVSDLIYKDTSYAGELKKVNFSYAPKKGDVVYFAPRSPIIQSPESKHEFSFLNWDELKQLQKKSRTLASKSAPATTLNPVSKISDFSPETTFICEQVVKAPSANTLTRGGILDSKSGDNQIYPWESFDIVLPVAQNSKSYSWESFAPVLPKSQRLLASEANQDKNLKSYDNQTYSSKRSRSSHILTKTVFNRTNGEWEAARRDLASTPPPVYEWESFEPVLPKNK